MFLSDGILDLSFFFKGILAGVAIAAPVGPIGLVCIRKTILEGRVAGLLSGIGASFADLIYGTIAVFGLTFLADTFLWCLSWLELLGATLLVLLGIRTFLNTPKEPNATPRASTYIGHFTSTFFLTLTNPLTFFAFLAIFSALGLADVEEVMSATLVLLGTFLGSLTWWFILSEGVTLFRNLLPDKIMLKVNHIAGSLLIFFGLVIFGDVLIDFCK